MAINISSVLKANANNLNFNDIDIFDAKDLKDVFLDQSTFINNTVIPLLDIDGILKLIEEYQTKQNAQLGALLLFSLRQFLTNQNIEVWCGYTSEGKETIINKIPLLEILKDQKGNLLNITSRAVEVSEILENSNDLGYSGNELEKITKIWNALSNLQDKNRENYNYYSFSTQRKYFYASGKGSTMVDVYSRNKKDTNVVMRFREGADKTPHEFLYYHHAGNPQYQYFNNGWLFEWLMEKWYNLQTENELANFYNKIVNQGNFGDIIQSMDNIAAYKKDDLTINSQSITNYVQAKYGNTRLISKYGLNKALSQLKQDLLKFKNSSHTSADKAQLAEDLTNLYAPSISQDPVAREAIEKLMTPLINSIT